VRVCERACAHVFHSHAYALHKGECFSGTRGLAEGAAPPFCFLLSLCYGAQSIRRACMASACACVWVGVDVGTSARAHMHVCISYW